MPTATTQGTPTRVRTRLALWGSYFPPAMAEALKSFLIAADYNDLTMMKAHLNAAMDAWRDGMQEEIRRRIKQHSTAMIAFPQIMDEIEGEPFEDVDELGNSIEEALDDAARTFSDLLAAADFLKERGYPVENAAQLDRCILEIGQLKEETQRDWPWSQKQLPRVDRMMIGQARAEIGRNEGEPIQDVIRQASGSKV